MLTAWLPNSRMPSKKIIERICPVTVAIAAPAIPIDGIPIHPKIKIGSRMMFVIAPMS